MNDQKIIEKPENSLDYHDIDSALKRIDRSQFVSCEVDTVISGRSILSEDVVRRMLSLLDFTENSNALHVGAGTGYTCAVLSHLVGHVTGIEKQTLLTKVAVDNIRALQLSNVMVYPGDGSKGLENKSPFDIILVTASKVDIHQALLEQLAINGQLLSIEDTKAQMPILVKYVKLAENNYQRTEHGCIYFSQRNTEIAIEIDALNPEVLNKAQALSKQNKTLLIDEVIKLTSVDDMELYRSLAARYRLKLGNVEELLNKVTPNLFANFSKAFLDHH